MPEPAATTFGLIRHAPTVWNEEKRIQGRLDSPLSERGRAAALSWGGQLSGSSWQRVLCSDQERTRQTAALVNRRLGLPLTYEAGLREQDWGEWSGLPLAALQASRRTDLEEQVRRGWLFTPPGGESRRQVLKRSTAALLAAHQRWPGQRILVICHEGVIKCLLYHLLRRKFLPEEAKVLHDFHLHLVEVRGDALYIEDMNAFALEPPPNSLNRPCMS